MEDSGSLNSLEIDALKEMGNIATGNATTALSILLNKNIDMGIPEARFIPIKEFSKEFGGPEKIVSSIYLRIEGGLKGESLFIFPKESSLEIVDIMMGNPIGTTKDMGEMECSAFKEMANILTGSFLTALSKMLNLKIMPSIPYIATDMVQAVIDFILIEVSRHADKLLCVKTKINVEGHNIYGDFLVLFDKPSLDKMLRIIQDKYGAIY